MAKATSIARARWRNHLRGKLNRLEKCRESPLYQRDSF
jgi:hypothetical protein